MVEEVAWIECVNDGNKISGNVLLQFLLIATDTDAPQGKLPKRMMDIGQKCAFDCLLERCARWLVCQKVERLWTRKLTSHSYYLELPHQQPFSLKEKLPLFESLFGSLQPSCIPELI